MLLFSYMVYLFLSGRALVPVSNLLHEKSALVEKVIDVVLVSSAAFNFIVVAAFQVQIETVPLAYLRVRNIFRAAGLVTFLRSSSILHNC